MLEIRKGRAQHTEGEMCLTDRRPVRKSGARTELDDARAGKPAEANRRGERGKRKSGAGTHAKCGANLASRTSEARIKNLRSELEKTVTKGGREETALKGRAPIVNLS